MKESNETAVAGFGRLYLSSLIPHPYSKVGRPLVLKADNGGHFRGADVMALLEREGVTVPRSPPYTPRYNGAIEAGIGSLKTRAHEEAALRGRPGAWTCEDIEAAREQANLFGAPRGEGGPSPEEAWAGREAITEQERAAFREALGKEIATREADVYDGLEGGVLQQEREKRRREATGAVLVARGYSSVSPSSVIVSFFPWSVEVNFRHRRCPLVPLNSRRRRHGAALSLHPTAAFQLPRRAGGVRAGWW